MQQPILPHNPHQFTRVGDRAHSGLRPETSLTSYNSTSCTLNTCCAPIFMRKCDKSSNILGIDTNMWSAQVIEKWTRDQWVLLFWICGAIFQLDCGNISNSFRFFVPNFSAQDGRERKLCQVEKISAILEPSIIGNTVFFQISFFENILINN